MANGPIYPDYAFTIWTGFGPIHYFYGDGSNWPPQPWLDTRGR